MSRLARKLMSAFTAYSKSLETFCRLRREARAWLTCVTGPFGMPTRAASVPLHHRLLVRARLDFRASFAELEAVLNLRLSVSVQIRRFWWANPIRRGGHSQTLA